MNARNTTAWMLLATILLVPGSISDAGKGKAQGKARTDLAPATVFLVGVGERAAPFEARIVALAAVADGGAEVALEPRLERIDPGAAGRQQALGTGQLPPALYRGLKFVFARPSPAEAAAVETYDLLVPGDFQATPGKNVTLNVRLDLSSAPRADGTLDPDAFVLALGDANVVRRLTLYVTDTAGDRVVAVNRDTDRVFAAVTVGRRPRGIDVPERGRRVFVANSGDDTITVIDAQTHQVQDTLNMKSGCNPEDVAVTPDGSTLAVSCPGRNLIALVDAQRNALLGEIALTRAPSRVVFGDHGRTVYALVPEGNTVVAADVGRAGRQPARELAVQAGPTDLVVDPIMGTVYVAHTGAPVITAVDPALGSVRRLQTGTFSFGLALDRDGQRLFASGGDAGGLSLIGPRSGSLIRRWTTPRGYRIALDPDGSKLFVTGGEGGDVLVIDRIVGKLIGRIPVGGNAFDLVVVP